MRYNSAIKKNFLFSALYQCLLIMIPLITTPYISRVFGASGIGEYTMVNTIASYFVLFAMMGVSTYGNRSIAYIRDNDRGLNETFSKIYYTQLFFCAITFVIYFIYIVYSSTNTNLKIIHFLYVLSAAFDISWLFYGIEKIDIVAKINFLVKIAAVIFIFMLVKNFDDLWIYAFIMCGSFLVSSLIAWILAFRYVKLVYVDIKCIVENLKPIIILFVPIIAATVYKTMDKIMLGTITGADELVGLYNNSEQMIGFPQGVITSIGMVMLPRAANMRSKGEHKKSLSELRISIRFVNFLSFGVTFGIASVAKEFVPIFLGNDFLKCIEYVIWLAPVNLFISWGYIIRNQYLIPNQKDKVYIYSIIAGAVINFTINMILIEKYNVIGVIIGTLIAEGVVAIWQTYAVRNEIKVFHYIKDTIPFFFSAAIMVCFVRLIGNYLGIHIYIILLEVLVGAIIYILFIALYLSIFERENFNTIRKMLKAMIYSGIRKRSKNI